MKKILIIAGTRPNFIKLTQFKRVVTEYPSIEIKIVHTGQHYDEKMAEIFFRQFGLVPDFFLNISQGTPLSQISEMIIGLEKLILSYKPDMILVPGDVNSTLAGSLAANRMNIPLAHIESGLRSFDRTMPEEFNRIIADDLADYFFVTEQSGVDNLLREGKPREKIFFVGNTMIDTMVAFKDKIENSDILQKLNLQSRKYILMTMHRPSAVDTAEGLSKLDLLIHALSEKYRVVFPVHPRTVKNMNTFGLHDRFSSSKNLILTDPLDYFSFQKLIKDCFCVVTDSGGIQEETTFLHVPCLTLRKNTERPVTITHGTNELIPFDQEVIKTKIDSIANGNYKKGKIPGLWDGKATERIMKAISKILSE